MIKRYIARADKREKQGRSALWRSVVNTSKKLGFLDVGAHKLRDLTSKISRNLCTPTSSVGRDLSRLSRSIPIAFKKLENLAP